MQITSNLVEYEKDLLELAQIFYPKNSASEIEVRILHTYLSLGEGNHQNTYQVFEGEEEYMHTRTDEHSPLNLRKLLQLGLYEALSQHLGIEMPWGALIGIRPVKMVKDLLKQGLDKKNLVEYLQNTYFVSKQKAKLLQTILDNQPKMQEDEKTIDFYVNIPFCTTRCTYCSFLSAQIGACNKQIQPYVDTLIDEIRHAKQLLAKKGIIVKNIYVGGGTPTAITCGQLQSILAELTDLKPVEFTVEAGRADTIDEEKLAMLKNAGVTRISINPQSFSNKVLQKAGRNHSVEQFLTVYQMAQKYNFIINCDLIAGLEGETLSSFKVGVDKLIALSPANITLHTLAIKRASTLNKLGTSSSSDHKVQKMLQYAYKQLKKYGYGPYYMYRQKNMLENLENMGFCKTGTECYFNINSIDDHASQIACGAGGVSKRVHFETNLTERAFVVKGIAEYLGRIEEMKQRKEQLFD